MANLSNINNKFIVEDDGDVGIGVTSATAKLHIRDGGTNADVGIKIGNDSRDWNMKVMGSVSDSFQIFTHDNSNIMTILSSGNVGIGTDDPQTNLEISDASGAALTIRSQDNVNGYSLINFGDSDDDNVGRIYYGHDDNAMRFRTNDSEKMRLTSGARINMDVMAGHESEGIIRIGRYDANTTRYNEIKSYISSTAASNYLKFSVHGGVESAVVDVMTLLGSGNVGIGTTSPGGLLTIKGAGDAIRVESTNTGVGGAQIDLLHFTTSPADNDTFALINMGGYYTGTTSVYGTSIKSIWTDVSARDADLTFSTNNSGTLSERMRLTTSLMQLTTGASNQGVIQMSTDAAYQIRGGGNYGYISLVGPSLRFDTNGSKRMNIDLNGGLEYQGAEPGVTGVRFQGSGTCNGYAGSLLSFYAMDVMRDQGSGKAMNVQGTIDIAAGYGIGFGASAGAGATSTLLDDYEEGTWTPVIDGSTSVSGQSYSRQEGSYTKVGNMITAWFSITLTAKGTIAGFLRISGLPLNGSAAPVLKPAAVAWSNMSMTANHQLSAEQFAANPFMYLYEMDASGTKTQIQTGAITDTTFITGTLTYRV